MPVLTVIAAACLATGCSHWGRGARRIAPEPLPAVVAQQFSQPRQTNFVFHESELAVRPGYAVKRIELDVAADVAATNRPIVFDYFLPAGPGAKPVIVILPVMGGRHYDLEEIFARYFARHGLAAVIVHREKLNDAEGITAIDPMLRQTVLDNRRVIDWIESRAELDATRLGVFGASMGGIKGALLAAVDGRVRASVLGLAGGDLSYILTHTTEPGVSKQRERMLRAEQLTRDEFQAKLKQAITCDPLAYARYIDANNVLMFVAMCDTVVPNKKGRELRTRMGKPEMVLLPAGHFTSVLFIPYIKSQSLRFFQRKLGLDAAGVPRSSTAGGPALPQRSSAVRARTSGGAAALFHVRER